MNRIFLLSFLFVFTLSFSGKCQFFNNSIVKIRPLQYIVVNPNIGLEKSLNNKFSLDLDLMYRNRTWFNNGGEWNFGSFMPSVGVRITTGFRSYISKKKSAPFGWFWGTQLVAKYSYLKEIDIMSFHGDVIYTQNIQIFQAEIVPIFGYQFHISKRITSEFYVGASYWPYRSVKTEIIRSDDPTLIGFQEHRINEFGAVIAPQFTWSIGFLLNKIEE